MIADVGWWLWIMRQTSFEHRDIQLMTLAIVMRVRSDCRVKSGMYIRSGSGHILATILSLLDVSVRLNLTK